MTVAVYFEDERGGRSDFGDASFWPSVEAAVADLLDTGALVIRDRRGAVVRPISDADLDGLRESGEWSYDVLDECGSHFGRRYICIYDAEESE